MENHCINCERKLTAFNEAYLLWPKAQDKLCNKCRKKADFFLDWIYSKDSAIDYFNQSRVNLEESGISPQGIQHLEDFCKYLDKLPQKESGLQPLQNDKEVKFESSEVAKPTVKNTVASIFTVMAWIIFIAGFLCGFIVLLNDSYFSLIFWASSFVTGMLFIGFAEIIKLLQKISDK